MERKKIHVICCCCSAAKSCPTPCNPIDCSMPGFPVLHHLLDLGQTHVYRVGDAIQPSHPLLPPSPPAFNLPQHQDLFKWVGSSHQVPKVLELHLQHLPFQWICFRKWEGSIHKSQDKDTSRELLSISEIRNYPQITVGDTRPAWQTSHLNLDSSS